ncbi:ABC transporter permease [Pleomorphochaeta sp. DL1XJH-081]|jgi:ribose transport system permease protein|uniref:ABC transporter permease n=1 Tax=Pleomorphochaeta sp. DL1XJH-081 TaxID=3409690 RepID=UPI003BB571DA
MNALVTQRKRSALVTIGRNWVFLFLFLEFSFFAILTRGFMSLNIIQMILFYGTEVFLLATAELFVIITGGIDLSVGYVLGFATVISSKLMVVFASSGLSPLGTIVVSILITLFIGVIPGFVNGVLVAKLRVPPFIATFSMLGVCQGISELLMQGIPAKNLPRLAGAIGNGHFLYIASGEGVSFLQRPDVERGVRVIEIIPNVVVFALIFIIIFAFILKKTRFGQHIYAIGGNIDAAIRAGIDVKKHIIAVYMFSSFFASLAGIIYVMKYITGKADAGAASLLDAIAAVVIGGASMFGGSGTVWRTIVGCLVIATLETGLRMRGTPTFDKYILVGIILIFTVVIERFFPDMKR